MKRLTPFVIAAALVLVGSAAMAAKVDICHVPPGDPGNAHTINVAQSAVGAHLGHGDTLGACECAADADCADANLCDVDHCVRGKCTHTPVGCPAQPCVQNLVCVPATGECVGSPVDCGDGQVCDPSAAGGCVPCNDFLLSFATNDPSTECPNSSDCLQCCHEGANAAHPGFFDTCSVVAVVVDNLPTACACLGCGCTP